MNLIKGFINLVLTLSLTYDRDKLRMIGSLEVSDPVLQKHVPRKVSLRLEGTAGWAAD